MSRDYQEDKRRRKRLRHNYDYLGPHWHGWIATGEVDPPKFLTKPWKRTVTWRWTCKNPRWWDHVHTIEPARRQDRAQCRDIVRGADSDGMLWPDHRKPVEYYW